uniref:RodZ domain-containing protein n=1 Tax=Thaumasiovibrio occultus TaxID=1891184 RepID=UPI000B352749|nr:RodZ domain-containing protein [Thaumasiovibrio occultus]
MTTENHDEKDPVVEVTGPGEVLKRAREAMGLTQDDVAKRLRLRTSVIQDIEANRFNQEKVSTFMRGYIRSYAKCVQLDEERVLAYLPADESAEQTMQSFSRRTNREKHDSRVMNLTWAIAALMIGVTAAWWWQSVQPSDVIEGAAPAVVEETVEAVAEPMAPEVVEVTATEIATPVSAAQSTLEAANVSGAEPTIAAAALSVQDATSGAVSTTDVVIAEEPVAEITTPDANVPALVLTFSGDCWVEVRDGRNRRLVREIRKAGETLELEGDSPFKLVLGAPDVVELRYQGETVDLSQWEGGVASFSLPL